MFAALIARPQAKKAGPSSDKSLLRREPVHGHERDIEQAHRGRTAPQRPGPSWDFSRIPVYTHGRRDGPERPLPAPLPRLPGPIQRKLKVGAVNDPLEHEADCVADQVMRMPDPRVSVGTAQPQISRRFDASEQEDKLQNRHAGTQAVTGEVPSSVHEVLRSPGQPLDPATRAYFEPRFGHDLSSVRVHADEKAAQSAQSIYSRAYTAGDDIVSGAGKFAPAPEGRRLLAHELTHVVQQGGAARIVQRAPLVARAASATKQIAKKASESKATSTPFNSYVDLFNGFQDLAAAALSRGGAGLDSARFGNDLSRLHRRLLWRVRTVLIQAQVQDKDQRLAAAAAWPDLAAKLLAAVAEAARLQFPGPGPRGRYRRHCIARQAVRPRAGRAKSEPEVESVEDYADAVRGMNDLLWIFGQLEEGGQGLIREEAPNRKEIEVSGAVLETNAKQRAALAKVQFGGRLNARHAKVLNTLRTALLLARSEAPGSAYKALALWNSIPWRPATRARQGA